MSHGPTSTLPTTPLVVRGAEAPTYTLTPGNSFSFLFADFAGQPEIYSEVGSRGDGPPMHRHPWGSLEVIIEGRVKFVIDGAEHVLEAGDLIFTPPNAAHAYMIDSDKARVLGINLAGTRFKELQEKASPLFQTGGPPDMGAIMRTASEVNVEVLGPPLRAASAG
ncbi:MAG: cupin domain-containing protein [Myxococcales bacterium]|nr:cupin domain-containing protein [Myxococcales bacterium]